MVVLLRLQVSKPNRHIELKLRTFAQYIYSLFNLFILAQDAHTLLLLVTIVNCIFLEVGMGRKCSMTYLFFITVVDHLQDDDSFQEQEKEITKCRGVNLLQQEMFQVWS